TGRGIPGVGGLVPRALSSWSQLERLPVLALTVRFTPPESGIRSPVDQISKPLVPPANESGLVTSVQPSKGLAPETSVEPVLGLVAVSQLLRNSSREVPLPVAVSVSVGASARGGSSIVMVAPARVRLPALPGWVRLASSGFRLPTPAVG